MQTNTEKQELNWLKKTDYVECKGWDQAKLRDALASRHLQALLQADELGANSNYDPGANSNYDPGVILIMNNLRTSFNQIRQLDGKYNGLYKQLVNDLSSHYNNKGKLSEMRTQEAKLIKAFFLNNSDNLALTIRWVQQNFSDKDKDSTVLLSSGVKEVAKRLEADGGCNDAEKCLPRLASVISPNFNPLENSIPSSVGKKVIRMGTQITVREHQVNVSELFKAYDSALNTLEERHVYVNLLKAENDNNNSSVSSPAEILAKTSALLLSPVSLLTQPFFKLQAVNKGADVPLFSDFTFLGIEFMISGLLGLAYERAREVTFTRALQEYKFKSITVITVPADDANRILCRKKPTVSGTRNQMLDDIIYSINNSKNDFIIPEILKSVKVKMACKIFNDCTTELGISSDTNLTPEQYQALYFYFKVKYTRGLINSVKADYCNFTCKDGIDRGGIHLLFDQLITSLIGDDVMKKDDFEKLLHAPALSTKGRPLNKHQNVLWNVLLHMMEGLIKNQDKKVASLQYIADWLKAHIPEDWYTDKDKTNIDQRITDISNYIYARNQPSHAASHVSSLLITSASAPVPAPAPASAP